ncbi:YihY/virulence factor BrkB family protein [Halorubellus sp. JP-L1]|uniref:YhjD/YihY/BrkB family envelope integrity protein n=1 Tax=Halorubellus sp. JP-L1 TaxID=2715753 RepID=UPI00140E6E5B|nr:YhjD/YihY/BrkB family envelope integrity protein [Halorubellus sp. JP-L1]NHN43065.1 YihY/virulence factor BrkB family protein [Halorubellus sp. JP-L1]
MAGSTSPVETGKRVFTEFSEKNVTFMAAGIAYNAFVSLAPLLILVLIVASFVDGLEERLRAAAARSLPGPIADVVVQIFGADATATGASVVGLLVLLWGTLKIFRGLDTAFSEIYETEEQNSFVDQVIDGLVVFVSLVVSIVATVGANALLSRVADLLPALEYVTPLVLVAGLVVAFFPMYYRFPDADLGWRDVLPGTVFAAVGWAALQSLFQVYLAFTGGGSASFFGGVLVVVTWLYFSGLVLLLGAVLNAVVGDHSTGEPGGVGRGAATPKPDAKTERSLDRAELASYLRDFRADLTGFEEDVTPTAGASETIHRVENGVQVTELEGTLRKARPLGTTTDEVEVVERTRSDGDERERTLTVRWRSPEGE